MDIKPAAPSALSSERSLFRIRRQAQEGDSKRKEQWVHKGQADLESASRKFNVPKEKKIVT